MVLIVHVVERRDRYPTFAISRTTQDSISPNLTLPILDVCVYIRMYLCALGLHRRIEGGHSQQAPGSAGGLPKASDNVTRRLENQGAGTYRKSKSKRIISHQKCEMPYGILGSIFHSYTWASPSHHPAAHHCHFLISRSPAP